jgi:hypothetical protein
MRRSRCAVSSRKQGWTLPSAWKETSRREMGVSTTDSPRSGASFALIYSVTECRTVDGKQEWRERMVCSTSIYQAKQTTVATAALLEVVAKGVKALSELARREDERATSRRKRR